MRASPGATLPIHLTATTVLAFAVVALLLFCTAVVTSRPRTYPTALVILVIVLVFDLALVMLGQPVAAVAAVSAAATTVAARLARRAEKG